MRFAQASVGFAFLAAIGLAGIGLAALSGGARAEGTPTYAEVAAILNRSCVHCHGGDAPVQGLALDAHAGILKGGDGGPGVVAGAPEKSLLVRRLRGLDTPQMPLDGDPLPEAEIALIEAWIHAGAPDAPKEAPAPEPPAAPLPRADEPVTWVHVGPILRARCVRCHQEKGVKGPAPEGIRLDQYALAVGGRERVVVVPGRPEASPLIRAVQGKARRRMPLDGPPFLSDEQVALLTRWVKEGARGEDGKPAAMPAGGRIRLFGVFDGARRVDDVDLVMGSDTRRDRDAGKGSLVEVRAIVSPDGSLRVERLRPRKPEDDPR